MDKNGIKPGGSRLLIIICSIILAVIISFLSIRIKPQHSAVWKSIPLSDTTQFDSIYTKLNRSIAGLHLVDPHRPVWKSFILGPLSGKP
jgi:hypothetical protein